MGAPGPARNYLAGHAGLFMRSLMAPLYLISSTADRLDQLGMCRPITDSVCALPSRCIRQAEDGADRAGRAWGTSPSARPSPGRAEAWSRDVAACTSWRRPAVLAARVLADAATMAVQAVILIVIGLAMGARLLTVTAFRAAS